MENFMIDDYSPHTVEMRRLVRAVEEACRDRDYDAAEVFHWELCHHLGKLYGFIQRRQTETAAIQKSETQETLP